MSTAYPYSEDILGVEEGNPEREVVEPASPNGLHGKRSPGELKRVQDSDAQVSKSRHAREAIARCGGNKVHAAAYLGVNVKTLEKWLGKPVTGSRRLHLLRVQVEAAVDEILASIPVKIEAASLVDVVKALKDLAPLLKQLSGETMSRDKKLADADRDLRERAKEKLAKMQKKQIVVEDAEKPN